jgi:hypothetical protein
VALLVVLCAAHLLQVNDPAIGKPLTPNQLKAEIAVFMAAGEAAATKCMRQH